MTEKQMKPIIFSTKMVKAILAGRKTQTRRVIKPQPMHACQNGEPPFWHWKDCQWAYGGLGMPQSAIDDYAPYQPGDILWVQEPWCYGAERSDTGFNWGYESDGCEILRQDAWWRHPEDMPRTAARIFLRVTDVRVERLREITIDDCIAEGISSDNLITPNHKDWCCVEKHHWCGFEWYRDLWDDLYANRGFGWESNPWVWVIEFERTDKNAAN